MNNNITPKPVILDMDPGVDDALAIILAVKSGLLDIKAITICGGNVSRDQCALNALKTLQVAGANPQPPVLRGASRPLRRTPFRASGIHGSDGLGDVKASYPEHPRSDLDHRSATEVILDTIRMQPDNDPLSIIVTGPLTNIAHAISEDAETMRKMERIWWMGGAYKTFGNISPVAEFNAFCDPEAAHEVLTFGIPMTVVGLDACMQCRFSREDMERAAKNNGTKLTQFALDITDKYMNFYRKHEGFHGCYLHDPLAVGVAIWPDLVTKSEKHHVEVITAAGSTQGMTLIDSRPRNPWINQTCKDAYNHVNHVTHDVANVLREFDLLKSLPHVEVVLNVNSEEFRKRFLEVCFS
jgi:purine nucleosidase/pyrimidine-specific ribonucleoside hydrolase